MNGYHYVQCGLDNVWLENGYTLEETAYGNSVRIDDVEALHRAIGECLTEKTSPLIGKEFRFLRLEMDMSQKRIGELLGKEAQTVALWEKSDELNRDVDFIIRHIYRQKVSNHRQVYEEMVDSLNAVERAEHAETIRLQDTGHGWARVA